MAFTAYSHNYLYKNRNPQIYHVDALQYEEVQIECVSNLFRKAKRTKTFHSQHNSKIDDSGINEDSASGKSNLFCYSSTSYLVFKTLFHGSAFAAETTRLCKYNNYPVRAFLHRIIFSGCPPG